MTQRHISRRRFLQVSAFATAGAVLAACGAGDAPAAEAPAAEEPAAADSGDAMPASQYNEAPMLAEMVANGEIPPVDERLPPNPMVIEPLNEVGQYGGTWRRIGVGPGDAGIFRYRLMYRSWCATTWTAPKSAPIWPNPGKSPLTARPIPSTCVKASNGRTARRTPPRTSCSGMRMCWAMKISPPVSPVWLTVGGEPVVMDAPDDLTIRFTFPGAHGIFMPLMAGANGASMTWYPKHYMTQFHRNYADEEELNAQAQENEFEFWHQYFNNRLTPA